MFVFIHKHCILSLTPVSGFPQEAIHYDGFWEKLSRETRSPLAQNHSAQYIISYLGWCSNNEFNQ